MAIPLHLLKPLGGHALGITIYGGAGLLKTNGVHTLPPPILLHDFEGGSASVLPWTRAYRHWNETSWTTLDQAEREAIYNAAYTDPDTKQLIPVAQRVTPIGPAPLIDVIKWDVLDTQAYSNLVAAVSNFDPQDYNSLACDSLQELATETQTFTKGLGGELNPMSGMQWGGAQERTALLLRKMDALRFKGVFVYFTSSENIDKDYVTDPRNQPAGRPPEAPFSVKGTVNLPGKLVPTLQHVTDILCHARIQAGKRIWVCTPEPVSPGSGAFWEAKDRTGRIKNPWMQPNVRLMLDQILGQDLRKEIYASARG